ncbi:lysophospholipid acyltransferase family protein [Flammeovirga sp. MY04]|uniref:lysophospholipid acyltransferase family protein n=1 Tax=Flammeovirga sp. MY04 TaxID=1191459 RepID=UPI0008262697|nr:lysophospholipid acyltransferase family protein [Flammeovirga sp. MY04]ANQ49396.2 lysophospholipid acyltransferase family protein [Flammeovirga sp. MY04]
MFFIRLFSKLPFPIIYLISDIIAFFTGSIIRYRRTVITQNVETAFPGISAKEKRKIIRGFYRNLCDVGFESLKSLSMSKEDVKKHITITNPEEFKKYHDAGKPILMMTGHLSNWEWQLMAYTVIMNAPIGAVYKPLSNKFSENLMQKIRSNFGGYVVPMEKTMREILVKHKRGEVFTIGMVADQSPPGYDKKQIWLDFFGKESAFFAGPEKVTEFMNYPVIFSKIRRVKRGYYEITIVDLHDGSDYEKGSNEILKKFSKQVEENIKEQPSNWLWSHKRWKYTREEVA